jgi:hypothetical protein
VLKLSHPCAEKRSTGVHIGDRDRATGQDDFHAVERAVKAGMVSRKMILDRVRIVRAEGSEQGLELRPEGCDRSRHRSWHRGLDPIERGRIRCVKYHCGIVDPCGVGHGDRRELVDIGDAGLISKGEQRTAYSVGGSRCFQYVRSGHVSHIDGK